MAERPAFMLDHMVVKLGKYLRILGYDAAWDTGVRTHDLIARANTEARVFVTRNTRLPHQYPEPRRLVRVTSPDAVEQLREIAGQLALDASGLFSKCIRCNVALEQVRHKEAARAAVHPNVFARYDVFHTCPCCGTVFWKGTHVRNTCAKLAPALPSDPNLSTP